MTEPAYINLSQIFYLKRIFLLGFLTILFTDIAHSQLSVTPSNAAIDPQALVETFFLGDGVEVTNITYTGDKKAVGFFTDGLNEIGMERGIVMGSGHVEFAVGPFNSFASTDNTGPSNDPDLDNISNVQLNDISKYEITFIPTSDTLRFRYVFASEEYPDFNCSQFNDVFGFFITGPDPVNGGMYNSKNIALVPDLSDPTGTTFTNLPVSIANVHGATPGCAPSFDQYYNDNIGAVFFAYGAYLDVFTAQAIVEPCKEYTIKLAIADGFDGIFDSAVFLEAKSFGTGSVSLDIQTVSLDGSIAEGCNSGIIVISIPSPAEEDIKIDAQLINCSSSATIDVDYFGLPNEFVIPKGETRIEFEIFAIDEGITEGDEFICFDIQKDICTRDTVSIRIAESPLTDVIVTIPNDTVICQKQIVFLNSMLPSSFVEPPAPFFEMSTNTTLVNELVPNTFPINVNNVAPEFLSNGVIKSVCIDTLEHRYLTDLDIFLVTPSGQFLELSTDNGKKPNNGADIDYMINTCFTPFGTTEIENGSSLAGPIFNSNPTYNGNFLPEGIWQDLYGSTFNTNGQYELLIIDDEVGAVGRFTGWSICFNPIYFLTYNWSSDVHGDICTNCENFPVEIDQNTTFYLNITDSYGCEYIDSFFVAANTLLPGVTDLSCDSISQDYIRITWVKEPSASSYEIFIPGVIDPAINIGDVDSYEIFGLLPLNDYEISIRGIGGICGADIVTTNCSTINCNVDDLNIINLQGVTCFGDSDGEIEVNITGVFPPFDYAYRGTSNGTGIFSNLLAGFDTLYITDFVGCVSKYLIEIPTPKVINGDFEEIKNISCNNETDGVALFSAFGGTQPYTYNWSNGEITDKATMLEPGMNFITVTDANQCSIVRSINFANPTIISTSHLSQDVKCFGASDGEAFINPNGGSNPYQYLWGDPLNQKTKGVGNLPANIYIVTVTDSNNCTATEEVIINQPAQLVTNVIGNPSSCFNSSDGEASVFVMGGDPPYAFLWDNGFMSNPVLNLEPGKHYVTVSDANSCIVIDSVIIDAPNAIEIVLEFTDPSCNGSIDGMISWIISGGTPPVEATILGIPVNSPLLGLKADTTYCITFTDLGNCTIDTCFTLSQPNPIILDFTTELESCFNSNDANIILSVGDGVGPFSYSWTGPDNFTANTKDLIGVNSGAYNITVTDSNSCTGEGMIFLQEPDEIFISSNVINIPCKGVSTGIINVTIDGGLEPYTFNWIGPNGFTSNLEDLIDVFAGTYTLIFKDSNGCTIQKTYEIIEPSQGIQSGISGDDEICFKAKNGIASIQPFGGTLPYDVTWSNGSKFSNINGLSPGIYYVTISDGSNCSTVDSVEVIERPEIRLEMEQTKSQCFESFDGSATVTKISVNSVAQDPNDYTFLWNSFPLQITQTAVNLQGGADYLVIVTDQLGCKTKDSIIIETPTQVDANIELIDSINCALGDDGIIVINGLGGSGPYTYQWGQKANFQVGPAAKNLRAGSYEVTITDKNFCTRKKVFEIQDPFPITLNYRIFDVLCFGEEDGEVELIANGGTLPYEYSWSNGSKSDEINGLEKGTYNITVMDDNGCMIVDSVFVSEPDEPIMLDILVNNVTCADGENGSIIIGATGGVGNYIYSLDNFIFNGSIEQIGLAEGVYNVYVKDANGCIDSVTNIDIFSVAPLTLDLGPDVYLTFGQIFQMDPKISNFTNPLSYNWKSEDLELLSCNDCQNPFFDATKQATYRLIVSDASGCIVEDYINLYISNDDAVQVPTGFTPNNDFNNDLLSVYGQNGIKVLNFKVYDQWGERMYENADFLVNDENIGWDGNFRNKPMMPGVYTWIVEAELTNGFIQIYSGNTTLIK